MGKLSHQKKSSMRVYSLLTSKDDFLNNFSHAVVWWCPTDVDEERKLREEVECKIKLKNK